MSVKGVMHHSPSNEETKKLRPTGGAVNNSLNCSVENQDDLPQVIVLLPELELASDPILVRSVTFYLDQFLGGRSGGWAIEIM